MALQIMPPPSGSLIPAGNDARAASCPRWRGRHLALSCPIGNEPCGCPNVLRQRSRGSVSAPPTAASTAAAHHQVVPSNVGGRKGWAGAGGAADRKGIVPRFQASVVLVQFASTERRAAAICRRAHRSASSGSRASMAATIASCSR
jgi:hypothetical protein